MARAAWWVGALLRFVMLPMLGVGALAWWLIGDRSTTGTDQIVQFPILQDHPRGVGAFGVVLVTVSALDLARSRPIPPRRYLVEVLPPVLAGGIGTGYAGRVITAHVHGANIGGGMAIMLGPIFLLGMISWAGGSFVSDIRRGSAS